MRISSYLPLTLLAAATFLSSNSAHAQAFQGSQVAGGSTLAFPGDGSTYTPTYSAPLAGNTLTFSNPLGSFATYTADVQYLETGFPVGTTILYGAGNDPAAINDSTGIPAGPLTISFATGVSSVAFNAEEYMFGPELFTFTAYDGATSLGTFTEAGDDPDALAFIGVEADPGYDITSLVLSDSSLNNIGIGPVTIDGTISSTPEPGSLTLLGTGVAALATLRRRLAAKIIRQNTQQIRMSSPKRT